MSTWENSPSSHSGSHCMFFYSNDKNQGRRFLPVLREPKEFIAQKQERPLQSGPGLGSIRQLTLLFRQHATWEASERPSSKPLSCCCQTSAWELTAQHPAAATHTLRGCGCAERGGWGSCSAAKAEWEDSEEWPRCHTASCRRGWLQSSGSFSHIEDMHTQTCEPNCFLTALL